MTDHYGEKEMPVPDTSDPHFGLGGLSNTTRFKAYLPVLDGVVEIGEGKDKHEARENYLDNLCNMITVLQNHKAKIISGESVMEVW